MLVVKKNPETSRTPLTRTSVGISPQLHLLHSMSALQTPGLKDQDGLTKDFLQYCLLNDFKRKRHSFPSTPLKLLLMSYFSTWSHTGADWSSPLFLTKIQQLFPISVWYVSSSVSFLGLIKPNCWFVLTHPGKVIPKNWFCNERKFWSDSCTRLTFKFHQIL